MGPTFPFTWSMLGLVLTPRRLDKSRDYHRFSCPTCRTVGWTPWPHLLRRLNGTCRVIATSLEAFIIRIFRQKNKDGFIKAFSDRPEPFTTGFSPLATMMRNLFVRRNMLWPRFDITVSKSLETKKPEVVELEIGMTESMKEIQTAILECIEASISELRKTNSQHLELEDWSVDSALHKNFDVIIRRQLDPVWHRVSYKTRQIVSDLTQFRNLLQYAPSQYT